MGVGDENVAYPEDFPRRQRRQVPKVEEEGAAGELSTAKVICHPRRQSYFPV
jgi:hypothetical protein